MSKQSSKLKARIPPKKSLPGVKDESQNYGGHVTEHTDLMLKHKNFDVSEDRENLLNSPNSFKSNISNKPWPAEHKGRLYYVQTKQRPELRHIAFLKVHKAASTTLQTMLFRFGYMRNLTFVLPTSGNYFSKSTTNHEHLVSPKPDGHYDILCNHGYFNHSTYSSLLPEDTVYIAIVREPWSQFVSAFHYYLSLYHFRYLENIPKNKMENLIKYPNIYEEGPLSYTMNSMAKDFGFNISHYNETMSRNNLELTQSYLSTLGDIFDLVLIKEYFDESIILMKRLLGWSLKDVLYMSKNVNSPDMQVSNDLMDTFKRRNRLDYLVYQYFLEKFQTKVSKEGDDFREETLNYRKVLFKVQNWCFDQYFGKLTVEATEWNEQFSVTSLDCKLMAKLEIDFINLLKGAVADP